MARQPTIWFREQNGWYYTTLRGEQVKLAQDEKEARKAFHTLLAQDEDKPVAEGFRPTFRKLADLYLEFTRQTKSDLTYRHQRYFLQSFCTHIKRKVAADIKPLDVTEWLLKVNSKDGRTGAKPRRWGIKPAGGNTPRWGHNTLITARGLVSACFNWAVEQGHLPYSPLAKMKAGTFHRRERILTKDERDRIRQAVGAGTFHNLLVFLEQTGARPYSEAAQITAAMIDWEEGSITLKKHKNARKGKSRVIYLTDALKSMLRDMGEKRPEGPLFVTRRGIPYNKGNVNQRLRRLEEKLRIPRFNLYSYRHSYITDALEKGLSSDIVAELCGNTPKTIAKYYSHLESKRNTLRDAARKAVS